MKKQEKEMKHKLQPSRLKDTKILYGGAPGWLSSLSIQLLVYAQVLISGL